MSDAPTDPFETLVGQFADAFQLPVRLNKSRITMTANPVGSGHPLIIEAGVDSEELCHHLKLASQQATGTAEGLNFHVIKNGSPESAVVALDAESLLREDASSMIKRMKIASGTQIADRYPHLAKAYRGQSQIRMAHALGDTEIRAEDILPPEHVEHPVTPVHSTEVPPPLPREPVTSSIHFDTRDTITGGMTDPLAHIEAPVPPLPLVPKAKIIAKIDDPMKIVEKPVGKINLDGPAKKGKWFGKKGLMMLGGAVAALGAVMYIKSLTGKRDAQDQDVVEGVNAAAENNLPTPALPSLTR